MMTELVSLLTFREARRIVRSRGNRLPAIIIGVFFAYVSMLVGRMLQFFPGRQGFYFYWVLVWQGQPWGDYPALTLAGPNFTLGLPWLPTLTMVVVATGVALGGGVAVASIRALMGRRREVTPTITALNSSATTAPAVTGLATLGSCCCVTCTTGPGVAVVAAVSGASASSLVLDNTWYIAVFQAIVVVLSLMILERNLRRTATSVTRPAAARARGYYASLALRMALMIAGMTWSLAMLVEWTTINPVTAPPAMWYHWIFEHQLLALLAVGAAVMPQEFLTGIIRRASSVPGGILRVGVGLAAITWGGWVPAQLTSLGLGGFLNELFGFLGLPVSWGAIAPDSSFGAALVFHWAFQHLLLSAFGLAFALAPTRVGQALLGSVDAQPTGSSIPTRVRPEAPSGKRLPVAPGSSPAGLDPDLRMPGPPLEQG